MTYQISNLHFKTPNPLTHWELSPFWSVFSIFTFRLRNYSICYGDGTLCVWYLWIQKTLS